MSSVSSTCHFGELCLSFEIIQQDGKFCPSMSFQQDRQGLQTGLRFSASLKTILLSRRQSSQTVNVASFLKPLTRFVPDSNR